MNLHCSALIPRKPLTNREQKREFYYEALRVVERLEAINSSFLYHLFNDKENRSFNQIYFHYADEWNKAIIDILKKNKFKSLYLDVSWFQRNYGKNIIKTKI